MRLGIGITTFPWPAEQIGPVVSRIATAADEAGLDSLWVMDHFFQIRLSGLPPESPMPEAYATLAFLGGLTKRIKLGTLVTSVAYRHPGVLVKTVTSLDVLTGGRVIFGVGAGAPWNIAPGRAGHRLRGGGPRHPVPVAGRAIRAAGGTAADRAPDVARRRDPLPGRALPAGPPAQLPELRAAAAPADPDRRQRRAQDPAPGGAVRRRMQPVRPAHPGVPRQHRAQAGRAPRATARRPAATSPPSRRLSPATSTSARTRKRARPRTWPTCASWPRPASTTPWSPLARPGTRPPSTRSRRSCPRYTPSSRTGADGYDRAGADRP